MNKIIPLLILFFVPIITSAQAVNNLNDLIVLFIVILETIIPILIGLAVLLFIWGLLRYYMSDNQNTKKEAVRIIGYGVVSIFVMVSMWGLVNFISYSLGLNINNVGGPNNTLPINPIQIR